MHRRPFKAQSQPAVECARFAPPIPDRLEAHSFNIGADEYVLLSFPVGAEDPPVDGIDRLTASERDIITWVLRGRPNAMIAIARGTSPRTIANQLAGIYAKLGVRSRRELRAKWDRPRNAT